MAEDEVKIKITAEDNYSGPMQRKIKMLERLAKQYAPAIKAAEKLDRISKVDRRVTMYLKADKVRSEMDRVERQYQSLKHKVSSKVLNMRMKIQENISRKLELLKTKTAFLKKPYHLAIALKDRASMKLAKIEGRAKWTMSKLRNLKNIPAGIRDRASPVIEKIKGKMAWLGKAKDIVINAKDKTSGVIGGIKSKLGSLISMAAKGITVAVTVIGAGALSAIKDGMQLESQTISMEHFIGVNNSNKSQSEIKGMTDDYISYLRENAKRTPFSTDEVIGAGSRAIGVTGGDITKAQRYLELAEDMAALTPGKSVMDAMEALADGELGEMERLKQFGFKSSKEEFDAAGGDMMKLKNAQGFTMDELFSGGAEKLSQSAGGLWSTVLGSLGDIKTNIGTQLLEKVKPGIKSAVDFLDKNSEAITERISATIGNGLNGLIGIGRKVGKVFNPLLDTIKANFEKLHPTIKSIKETAGKLFDSLLEHGVPMLQDFIDFAAPIFDKLWNVILKPFIDWIISQMPVLKEAFKSVLDFLGPKIETLIDLAGILGPIFKLAWDLVKSAVQIAWSIIEPIFTWIFEKLQMLIDKVKEMKEKYGSALGDIGGFFTELWNKVEEVAGWISGKIDTIITKAKEAAEFVKGLFRSDGTALSVEQQGMYELGASGSSYNGRPHASGIRNVPRDNYPALLHKGEAVVPARDNRGGKGKGGNITVAKLADTIVVREEADIDSVMDKLAKKLEETALNMA